MNLYQKLQGIDASKVKNESLKEQITKAQSGFTEDGLENETIKKTVERLILLTEKTSPDAMKGFEQPKAAKTEKAMEQPKAEEKKPVKAVKTAPAPKSKPVRTAAAKPKPTASKATPAKAKTGKGGALAAIWAIAKSEGVNFAEATKLYKQKSGVSKEVSKTKKDGAYTKEINKMKKAGTYGKATAGNNIAKDRQRDALPAGKRTSVNGKTYYEYRANRADWNPRLRLAMGGAIEGEALKVAEAIYSSNNKKGKVSTSYGDKTLEGLKSMIENTNYSSKEIADSIFFDNEKKGKISTSFGDKTYEGLLAMINHSRESKFVKGGAIEGKKYEITFENVSTFETVKKEAELTNAQYEKALQQKKNKDIVVDSFKKSTGIREQLRIKDIKPMYAKGGSIDEATDMTQQHLEMLSEYSETISKMLSDNTQLDTWVIDLLSKAEQSVADVKHNIEHLNPAKFSKGGNLGVGKHVKMQMLHINTYANEMLAAIEKGLVFEPWMSVRLAVAAANVDRIKHYLDTTIGGKKLAKGGAVEGKKYFLTGYSASAAVDDYEEGEETESVSDWEVQDSKTFNTKEELVNYINENIINKDYEVSDFDWETGEGTNIQTDVLSTYDDYSGYSPASKAEIESWKKGKKKLFNVHYFIYVRAAIPTMYAKGGSIEVTDIKQDLLDFDLDELDMFEQMQYDHFSKFMPKDEALQVLINNVEGDYGQLSPELAELAEKQLPFDMYPTMYAKGGAIKGKKLCKVRPDIKEDELSVVSVSGDFEADADEMYEYRWLGDEKFEIKIDGRWVEFESIDFDFDSPMYANGGGVDERFRFGIEYKEKPSSRVFRKTSLTMVGGDNKEMNAAIEKNAQALKKQEGWHEVRITKEPIFEQGGMVEGNEVWKVVYLDKDGEYIDETEVDEKDDELAWDLFKEFGHKKEKGTYLQWEQMDDEEYAKGGAVELANDESLLYFLRNKVKLTDIEKIARQFDNFPSTDPLALLKLQVKAAVILKRNGDKKYSSRSFKNIIEEAIFEYQDDKRREEYDYGYTRISAVEGKLIDTEELHAKIQKAIEAAEATQDYEFRLGGDDDSDPNELYLYDKKNIIEVRDSAGIRDKKLREAVEHIFEEIKEHNEHAEPKGEAEFMGKEIERTGGGGFFGFLKGILPFMD